MPFPLATTDDNVPHKALTMSVPQQQPREDVLRRIQGEYIEMPGLRLTVAQAQRLWGLDRAVCDAVLIPRRDQIPFSKC